MTAISIAGDERMKKVRWWLRLEVKGGIGVQNLARDRTRIHLPTMTWYRDLKIRWNERCFWSWKLFLGQENGGTMIKKYVYVYAYLETIVLFLSVMIYINMCTDFIFINIYPRYFFIKMKKLIIHGKVTVRFFEFSRQSNYQLSSFNFDHTFTFCG